MSDETLDAAKTAMEKMAEAGKAMADALKTASDTETGRTVIGAMRDFASNPDAEKKLDSALRSFASEPDAGKKAENAIKKLASDENPGKAVANAIKNLFSGISAQSTDND